MLQMLCTDTRTVINHRNTGIVSLLLAFMLFEKIVIGMIMIQADRNRGVRPLLHGIIGIVDQVHQHLL